MSIFTRDCPVCAAQHPVHAARCGCGYVFDPNKLDGVTQELEVISQEEKLYSDYLAARADQAEETARVARQLAARDPGNTVKAADALLAEQTALAARSEFNAQNSRAHAVSARVKVVRASRSSRRVAKQAADRAKKPKPASVQAALAPVAVTQVPKAAPVAAIAPAPKLASPKPIAQAVAVKPAVQTAPAPIPAPVVIAKPHPQKAAPKSLAMAPQSIVKPAPVKATKPIAPPPLVAVPAPSAPSKPAATVLKPVTPPAALPNAAETPLTFDRATPAFKATQASRAEEVHSITARSTHECPNCTAMIKPNAKRCGCGFELVSTENQIPALSLSPEEQAAFMAALTPSVPRNKG